MILLHYLANIFAGLFLCNCIPHLASGLRGEPFPSPFAKPRGVGNSSALTNVLWGTVNLIIGCLLLSFAPFSFGLNLNSLLFAIGFLAIGIYLARHFESVRNGKRRRN